MIPFAPLTLICLLCMATYTIHEEFRAANDTLEKARIQKETYCNFTWRNLPCLWSCKGTRHCVHDQFNYTHPTEDFRRVILSIANEYRAKIAGGIDLLHFPPAANLRALTYDKECEFFAGCFLRACRDTDFTIKITQDGTMVGATGFGILSFNYSATRIDETEVRRAFDGWFNSAFGPSKIVPHKTRAYFEAVLRQREPGFANDFLQMANAATHRIGCATYPRRSSMDVVYYQFYCIYKPAVRLGMDAEVYKFGEPASRCDVWGLKPNSKEPRLCGEVGDLSEDKFVPYRDLSVNAAFGYSANVFVVCLWLFLI